MFMKEAAYYMFGYITQLKLAYTGTMYTEMFVLMHATFITYVNQLPPERVVNTAVWYVCYFILLEMHNCVFCESLSFLRGKLTQCGNTSGRIQGTTGRVEPITV